MVPGPHCSASPQIFKPAAWAGRTQQRFAKRCRVAESVVAKPQTDYVFQLLCGEGSGDVMRWIQVIGMTTLPQEPLGVPQGSEVPRYT